MKKALEFNSQWLNEAIYQNLKISPQQPLFVAYSGGVDSHALLYACAQLRRIRKFKLTALHVDHGLNACSGEWVKHCANVCNELDVEFRTYFVDCQNPDGASLEAHAREKRYQWLETQLPDDGVLLSAHHQDDQAETLLLQLMRGAGVAGLAGMPTLKSFGKGWFARPLLSQPQRNLHNYASRAGLKWIEDPSNDDNRFERNYLRNEIVPKLKQRWPSVIASTARSAGHIASALAILDETAARDLQRCISQQPRGLIFQQKVLQLKDLRALSLERAITAIRSWCMTQNRFPPSSKKMMEIERVFLAKTYADRGAVNVGSYTLAAHRDALFILPRIRPHQQTRRYRWDLEQPLMISETGVRLVTQQMPGQGIDKSLLSLPLEVDTRVGGERIELPGRRGHTSVKKLLHASKIPAWERFLIPILKCQGKIVCIPQVAVASAYCVDYSQTGVVVTIEES